MRLICPNCDARYEVPDEVMPAEGRDVQCSNCGQTWFQAHPLAQSQQTEAAIDPDLPDPDEEISPPPPLPQTAAPRRELDPEVTDILRQEAEAEQNARRADDPPTLESQPDLGIDSVVGDEAERRAQQARERMARMRGEDAPDTMTAAAAAPRRELLPDIEEINSTLRSSADRSATVPTEETSAEGYTEPKVEKKKRSWRRGFITMLVIFVLLWLLYLFAPRIIAALPQVEPILTPYVAWVDQLRGWLDGVLQSAARWLDAKASASAE